MGQMYLVSIVALIVGSLGRRPRAIQRPSAPSLEGPLLLGSLTMNDRVRWVLVAGPALACSRRSFSPPISIWAYVGAGEDGALGGGTVVLSVVLGAAGMASVIVVLMLKKRFRYADVLRVEPVSVESAAAVKVAVSKAKDLSLPAAPPPRAEGAAGCCSSGRSCG